MLIISMSTPPTPRGHLGPKPTPAIALVAAAAVAPTPVRAARPWSRTCGGCVFSGDYDGAPLARTGSCATDCTSLDLRDKVITSCADDAFSDMGALE